MWSRDHGLGVKTKKFGHGLDLAGCDQFNFSDKAAAKS